MMAHAKNSPALQQHCAKQLHVVVEGVHGDHTRTNGHLPTWYLPIFHVIGLQFGPVVRLSPPVQAHTAWTQRPIRRLCIQA